MSAFSHKTVLLEETVAWLRPGVGKVIVDGTLGGGGHAEALLERGAHVLGIDQDPRALSAARQRLHRFGEAFTPILGNFGDLRALLKAQGVSEVDGVVLDLGVSSPQLDEAERGFSFQKDGPLDMRMGEGGLTAAMLIAQTEEADLAELLKEDGEEPFARPIARALKEALPQTTFEAVACVKRAVPRKAWPMKIHVATRTFQALRMAVNSETSVLERVLEQLPVVLKVGGVASIITFHSLEDRRVKQAFRALEGSCTCPPGLPVCVCPQRGGFKVLTRKAVAPSDKEISENPRARSAHLRAVERVR